MKQRLGAMVLAMIRSRVMASVAASAIFGAAIIAVPAVPVLADPPPPATTAPAQSQANRLERLFRGEQSRLAAEQKRLTRTGDLATRIQGRIDNLKSHGKNTTELEKALAGFKAKIASGRSLVDTAKIALDARAGFDANGKVVDAAKARETIRTAGKAERQAYQTMRKAVRELRKDVEEYRKANTAKVKGARGPAENPAASKKSVQKS